MVADQLKQALRGFAQTVVIVSTVDSAGERYAMAATAVVPVSMDPPSMLVCINRNASAYGVFASGADFCLNILGANALDIAQGCAMSSGPDRFKTGDWRMLDNIPYLAEAQAAIHCSQSKRVSHGSHDIIFGDVLSVQLAETVDPLLYLEGTYRRVGDQL
ncbi:MAG: flavin reductase family protein [Sphingomonas sp.]|nr:flavin reductase family protein [Sphingomonas sp.]